MSVTNEPTTSVEICRIYARHAMRANNRKQSDPAMRTQERSGSNHADGMLCGCGVDGRRLLEVRIEHAPLNVPIHFGLIRYEVIF